MKIIPAIDLKGGHCVRLYQGDFARETRYSDDPPGVARRFADMGFNYLHVVDLDGAESGDQRNRDIVRAIVDETSMAVQLGGGIRDRDTLAAWFDAGVSRAVIGSVAVTSPESVSGWLRDFGPDRLVLALDCRMDEDGQPVLATHGWVRDSGVVLWDAVERYAQDGLRHVLCTDVSRDGALAGPSVALYTEFVERHPGIELQASGGVRDLADLETLRGCGAAAAITGRAMLDGRIRHEEIESFRQSA